MISLKELSELHFEIFTDANGKIWYRLLEPVVYTSHRYGKTVTIPEGYVSDGATCAIDIVSKSWWVHDRLCDTMKWDDGSFCSPWQSSMVLHDILLKENRWFRADVWFVATFVYESLKNQGTKRVMPTLGDTLK